MPIRLAQIVWHILEGSFDLILANAMHIKNASGRKTDVNDAMWIADLLAHGLIRGSFVPPVAVQGMRAQLGAAYYMLRDGVEYRDLGGDRFERNDKSKTITRLVRKLRVLGCDVEIKQAA